MYDPTQKIRDMAFGSSPDRTLIVCSPGGLNNRIRVLISGIALAEAAERKFAMLWPDNPACGAKFDELFQNKWPVVQLLIPPTPVSFFFSERSNKRLKLLLEDPR